MDHELLESSLLYHGTYLLDELRREQQVSIDDNLVQWFRSHLPHASAPKLVLIILFIADFFALLDIIKNSCNCCVSLED